jgi:hypothetical protein
MWDHYIGRQIRRANRNLLWANGLLVLLVLGVGFLTRNYLYNFFFGPFPLDPKTLLEIKDPKDRLQYFVAVQSVRIFPGLGQQIRQTLDKNTRTVKNETVVAEYAVALIKDEKNQRFRGLVVKTSGKISGEAVDGALVEMPQDVRSQIVDPEEAKAGDRGRGLILRTVMLDATGFRTPGYWGLGFALPILAFGLWNVLRGLRRAVNPERHPLVTALVRFGAPAEVAQAIQEEVEQEAPNAGLSQTVLTRSWLLRPSHFGLKVIHLEDVVWVYKKVTKHSTNGVPTGTTYATVINQRSGASLEIGGSEQSTGELIQRICNSVPWILAGFDQQVAGLYQKKREVVVGIVDERRQAALNPDAGQAPAPPAE